MFSTKQPNLAKKNKDAGFDFPISSETIIIS